MDLIVYALCKKLIHDAVSSLGNVFSLKTTVQTYDDLPTKDVKPGDIYLVGPKSDGSFDEYYWSTLNTWELMGTTATDLRGYVNETMLYKGEQDTGTPENPAPDTLFYIVNSRNREIFLAIDNEVAYTPTGDYNPATKKYVDDRDKSVWDEIENIQNDNELKII